MSPNRKRSAPNLAGIGDHRGQIYGSLDLGLVGGESCWPRDFGWLVIEVQPIVQEPSGDRLTSASWRAWMEYPKTKQDLPSNLTDWVKFEGRSWLGDFGKQLWSGRRSGRIQKIFTCTREGLTFVGRALGPSFLVILGRFWSGRWGGGGVWGGPDVEKPSAPEGGRGLEGLGSWWVVSGGGGLGGFRGHSEADQAVTVANSIEGDGFLGRNAVIGKEPLTTHQAVRALDLRAEQIGAGGVVRCGPDTDGSGRTGRRPSIYRTER